MALLNFKARFAEKIEAREKRQTIRAPRLHPTTHALVPPAKVGELLHLYTGCRTKAARRLLDPVRCLAVERLIIDPTPELTIIVGDLPIRGHGLNEFARMDGFENFAEMMQFWFDNKRVFPWEGYLIRW